MCTREPNLPKIRSAIPSPLPDSWTERSAVLIQRQSLKGMPNIITERGVKEFELK